MWKVMRFEQCRARWVRLLKTPRFQGSPGGPQWGWAQLTLAVAAQGSPIPSERVAKILVVTDLYIGIQYFVKFK